MGHTLLILISIIAGVLLGTLSNWLYDLFKRNGIFPNKPTIKRLLITVIAFLPLIILVILPEINSQGQERIMSADELRSAGAFVQIESIDPSPTNKIFIEGEEQTVIAKIKYNLPGNSTTPQLDFQYLDSTQPIFNSMVIQKFPAEVGIHRVQMVGKVKSPKLSNLYGIPFQIEATLSILEKGLGTVETVASDKVIFQLEEKE